MESEGRLRTRERVRQVRRRPPIRHGLGSTAGAIPPDSRCVSACGMLLSMAELTKRDAWGEPLWEGRAPHFPSGSLRRAHERRARARQAASTCVCLPPLYVGGDVHARCVRQGANTLERTTDREHACDARALARGEELLTGHADDGRPSESVRRQVDACLELHGNCDLASPRLTSMADTRQDRQAVRLYVRCSLCGRLGLGERRVARARTSRAHSVPLPAAP